jgi:hypothetical protein
MKLHNKGRRNGGSFLVLGLGSKAGRCGTASRVGLAADHVRPLGPAHSTVAIPIVSTASQTQEEGYGALQRPGARRLSQERRRDKRPSRRARLRSVCRWPSSGCGRGSLAAP